METRSKGAKRMRAPRLDNGYFDLPDGIVFDILLRLPVTSLGRFKCVCKHWYGIIESRDFTEQHFALQNNSAFVLTVYGNPHSLEVKIISGKNLRVVESVSGCIPMIVSDTIGSCRGLFLIDVGCLGLLNPATKAFRGLPMHRMITNNISGDYSITYGLGWCHVTNDYKVVCFMCRQGGQIALVYTLSTDSWRLIDSPIPNMDGTFIVKKSRQSIYTSGFCYWLPVIFQRPLSLISFDVSREIFMTISLPHNVIDDDCCFSSYYDSLALLAMKEGDVEVWTLQQERQQRFWTKMFSFRHTLQDTIPCGIWNNTHILLLKRMSYPLGPIDNELLAYDMNSIEEGVIDTDHVEKLLDNYILSVLNYKKTMVSIKGVNTTSLGKDFSSKEN